jgi:hypothetical protein
VGHITNQLFRPQLAALFSSAYWGVIHHTKDRVALILLNYDNFLSNLKVTFKFVGLAGLAISIFVVFDSIMDKDYSNILIPLYFLALSPVIVFAVTVYTILKKSSLNKFLCSILFSISVTASSITFHMITEYIDATEIDIGFILRISGILFVGLTGIYFQLPWKQDSDV